MLPLPLYSRLDKAIKGVESLSSLDATRQE